MVTALEQRERTLASRSRGVEARLVTIADARHDERLRFEDRITVDTPQLVCNFDVSKRRVEMPSKAERVAAGHEKGSTQSMLPCVLRCSATSVEHRQELGRVGFGRDDRLELPDHVGEVSGVGHRRERRA